MKTGLHILFFISLSVLLCACPYSSTHMLDESPGIYVEDELIGNWATFIVKPKTGKQEPVKVILSKKTDTEYTIAFTGSINELKPFKVINKDTVNGSAFMSTVAGKQFLNISVKGSNYIAEVIYKNGLLSIMPLSDHFTAKMVMSNYDLRNCVELHYKTRVHPLYDEEFCLKEMIRVN
jgi:hypothetical protein